MKMLHDSRSAEYRSPYGAVLPNTSIRLAIDLIDVPEIAAVTLRVWAEGKETLVLMHAAETEAERVRYEASYTPETEGTVWYHFIVAFRDGSTVRYGAQDGLTGGEGCVRDWEPPSFQLTVHKPTAYPLAWYEPVGAYLSGRKGELDPVEMAKTLHEQYPASLYADAFPWYLDDPDCTFITCENAGSEMKFPLEESELRCFAIGEDVCGFWCRSIEGATLCAVFNTSFDKPHSVYVPLVGEEVTELVGGYGLEVVDADELDDAEEEDEAARADEIAEPGDADEPPENVQHLRLDYPVAKRFAHVHLGQLGWALLHFHDHRRLQREMEPGLGVLAHLTSLPASKDQEAASALGAPAFEFVDWLVDAGVRYWQVLPVNPTDEYGSPYAGISAFAGNDRLLGPEGSFDDARLKKEGLAEEYQRFCEREADWLEPYACFIALRQKFGEGVVWQEWPKRFRCFNQELIEGNAELAKAAEACKRVQFAFDCQWRALRTYANERGVLIIGDMPIYVSADSADVWANPQFFKLGDDGKPLVVAGCPPDAFAEEGQIWGNPVYDWEALKADAFTWWVRRLERAFELYDVLRLDHFIGFSRFFEIPAGEKALAGSYHSGPGIELFQEAFRRFGALPIVAEDLGLITPGVRSLTSACGFPGMDIAQFVDGNDPLSSYMPRPEKIAYTGTHDNQTLAGYCEARYPELDAIEAAQDIARNVAACPAPVVIMPLQDLMGLNDEARMNTPGVAEGNWTWQAQSEDLGAAAVFAQELVELKRSQS